MNKLYIIAMLSIVVSSVYAKDPEAIPGINKTHVTISCGDGYTQQWPAQGTTLMECTSSPDAACCQGLIKQAVCSGHKGVNPPINPPACNNPDQVKKVMDDLNTKLSPTLMAQIRSMLMQKQNGTK